jgi:hypothetical protein
MSPGFIGRISFAGGESKTGIKSHEIRGVLYPPKQEKKKKKRWFRLISQKNVQRREQKCGEQTTKMPTANKEM